MARKRYRDKLGKKIKKERCRLEYTIDEFIFIMDIEISKPYVSMIESGDRLPTPFLLRVMAETLDLEVPPLLRLLKRIRIHEFKKQLEPLFTKELL